MENNIVRNIYVLETGFLRKGLTSGWVGPLVLTRHVVYFISLKEIDIKKQLSLSLVAGWKAFPAVQHAIEKAIEAADKDLNNLENFTGDLDNLVNEKENSLKINKTEIASCKISKKYYPYGCIAIKTKGKTKHEISYAEPNEINPKIISFMDLNGYPLKVGWGV